MTDQATPAPSEDLRAQMQTAVAENRTWFTVLGVALIVLGALAIIFPLISGVAVTVLVGWLIFIAGVAQIVHAFPVKRWGGFIFSLLVGILYLITGGWIAMVPLAGIITLTILLSAAFILQGVLETVMAFRVRGDKGWGWMLASGIVALIVGVLIFAELPSSAGWALGFLTGINLLSSGIAFAVIAQSAAKQ